MDASVSLSSSIRSSLYSLASHLLEPFVLIRMLKIVCSSFLTLFLNSRNFDSIYSVFFANSSKFATKSLMRDCGFLSHKHMVLSSKLDEFDTDMGSRFPIQIIFYVGFSCSNGTQIDSKPKMARF